MELHLLRDLVITFAVAVITVGGLRRLGVPPIAGFIVVGAAIGPRALGLVSRVQEVERLAEIGVVLLLFGIGLELSLERLRRLWRPILLGGSLQVGLTLLGTTGIALGLGAPLGRALFLGCVVSVSSTAIVLRGLDARGELGAPHGRLTLGVLVFQDLCVVPMILALPAMAGTGGGDWALPLLKAAGVLAGILVLARLVVPRALHLVARTRQRELFVLTVLLICLGTAWAVSQVGISLALGAFLAGLVVAGSEYRHQATADLLPLREVLGSLFFVSVGMLFDPAVLWDRPGTVLALLSAVLVGKFGVVMLVGVLLRLPLRVWVLAGAALSQIGEFSFILMNAAAPSGLLPKPLGEDLLAAVILSMLVTPVALVVGPHVAAGIGRLRPLTRFLDVPSAQEAAQEPSPPRDHVIIAGFGLTGQGLAASLRVTGVPYVIVDLNPERVRELRHRGEPAYYGDVTSAEVLDLLGANRARDLVIAINDPTATERALAAARRLAPHLPVLVRARFAADAPALTRAGATDVVIAEVEAATEITARVLASHGVPEAVIRARVEAIRQPSPTAGAGE